jgi:hypothetical protein
VAKFVSAAITLKQEMTKERAIYRYFMISEGKSVDETIFNISEEERSKGTVFLCTFPGLVRMVTAEGGAGKVQELIVIKASGELKEDILGAKR